MTFSIRRTIRAVVKPEHRLSCPLTLWREGLAELRRRGHSGRHESGAFLLGHCVGTRREVKKFAYYDDLDPHSLDTGIVIFDGAGYGPLWELCRETGLTVVADVHTHPASPRQSNSDRTSPMIAKRGHFAVIVPRFAEEVFMPERLGIYEYEGEHRWIDRGGSKAGQTFYIGYWG